MARQTLSEEKYDDALKLYSQLLKFELPRNTQANVLNELGVCYKNLGEYAKAEGCLEKSLNLARPKNRDAIRINLSNLYLISGGYQKAIDCLNQIADYKFLYKKLLNLSHAYFRRNEEGDANKAIELIEECLTKIDTLTNRESYYLALQNRGYIYWELDSLNRASEDLETALKHINSDKGLFYIVLANLAMIKASNADFISALTHIDRVLAWQEKHLGSLHPDYIISLRKKAEILMMMKKKKEAKEAFRKYYEAEKSFILKTFPKLTEQRRLDFWAAKKPLLSEIFQLENTDAEFLYEVALFRRNISLLSKNEVNELPKNISITPKTIRKSLSQKDVAIEFVCYYDNEKKDTVYTALLTSHNTPSKYIYLFTKKEFHGYKLKKSLDLETCICQSYSLNKNYIYNDTVLAKKVWDPVLKEIPQFVNHIYFAPDGLLQMLAIEYLPHPSLKNFTMSRLTSTSKICISDNKSNSKQSLVIGGINYDKYEEINDTVGEVNHSAYKYFTEHCGAVNFNFLQGTVEETDAIRQIIPTAVGYNPNYTSESFLKQNMNKYTLVHLATHGYSLNVMVKNPPLSMRDSLMADHSLLASGLVFSGANIAGNKKILEDGLLSSRELCELDLSNVELIILSACQTAQGYVSDEGPSGIVRGLKKAGVKTIIATLWEVDDEATKIFMNAFYEAWVLSGKTKSQSMEIAQQTVKNYTRNHKERRSKTIISHRKKNTQSMVSYPFAQPKYWTPFILIDDI